MKKIIFNLLTAVALTAGSTECFAQATSSAGDKITPLQESDGLVRDSLIDKFVGTWAYAGENVTFKLVLTKVETKLGAKNSKIRVEQLNGGYVVIKNSKEVANTLDEKPLWGSSNGNTSVATFSIHNPKSDKYTNVNLRYLDKDTVLIEQDSAKGEGVKFDKVHNFPLNLKLKRQK
jgi:hypothetical protein